MVDAREYHERTKHTPQQFREMEFELDFDNQPRSWKVYADLPRRSLGAVVEPPETPALSAVATATAVPGSAPGEPPEVGLEPLSGDALTTLCHYANGVTKTLERGGEPVAFRAASCTGKLYHVDCYVVCGDLDGVDAGVYQYDPESDAFHVLREGDYRGVLAVATGGQEGVAEAPVTVVATSTWWRNAWKYRDRTYRHAFWDSGTVLANLLAAAHAGGRRAEVVAGFADAPVVDLLGLDPVDEGPLALVPVGGDDPAPDGPDIDPIDPEVLLDSGPVDYPLVHDAWEQSSLPDGDAAREWRGRVPADEADGTAELLGTHGPGSDERLELDPVEAETASARPLGNTIRRRGSAREYSHDAISDRLFATVLDRALAGVPTDCFDGGHGVLDHYCLVHAVDGIESGAYQYHPDEGCLERLGATDRETAGDLAAGQSVVGDAAVNVYTMADVDALVELFGNRGYRLAQLQAGVELGRLYLTTYAHRRLGGRGFTFFDDLVTDHLSPRAANQTPMTLFAFGKPA
ncbi:SagB family peptide dehydrogenase [Haloarchaeobius iranensis]|uniref:SagB-type dehydrogenase domain-containing protein n=1 Tax=Haloarchaeobius iranensis TaxID=996166 RepID=A0A1G9SXF6_9EURY|nr:SagB family peptide dehydrogenase [Haloarchaeobius iranensis]SDM40148.1 SagB-type dehydrogenase domain-containing protein [Haloarchaeobius iranensis]